MCTSHVAVMEFIEAFGIWAEESLLKRLCQASFFSIMADNGIPEEHFFGNSTSKKADTESASFHNFILFNGDHIGCKRNRLTSVTTFLYFLL